MAKPVQLTLTLAEATALRACANEGAEGIAEDESVGWDFLGGHRAFATYTRAYAKLEAAISQAVGGADVVPTEIPTEATHKA